jgi:hypothetical protein
VIQKIQQYVRDHGTKMLGAAQVTVGAIAAGGIIPAPHMKYWMTAAGVLTAWRGFVNSQNLK